MGQRTKNRIREHSGDGHDLQRSKTTHAGTQVTSSEHGVHAFWRCKCGWEGWLTNKLDDPE